MQNTIYIQLIVKALAGIAVLDIIEVGADSADGASLRQAAKAIVKYAEQFNPDAVTFRLYIDTLARVVDEPKVIDLAPGKPVRCRKERLCVSFDDAKEVGAVHDRGAYPVDLDAYLISFLAVHVPAGARPGYKPEPAVKAEPKPVDAFPGREERSRAAALPAAERVWVEETIQGVAGIIGEVATGKDVYVTESEFIEIAVQVEDRIDPALAATLLDEVGPRFRQRSRAVWLNITDATTEWALAEAESRTAGSEDDGPTEALLDRIRAAIRRTWGAIAYDILAAAGEDSLPIEEVVEVTLDADHVHSHGGDDEAAKALDAFDYERQNELAIQALS